MTKPPDVSQRAWDDAIAWAGRMRRDSIVPWTWPEEQDLALIEAHARSLDAAHTRGQAEQREVDIEILEDLKVGGGECSTWDQALTEAVNAIQCQTIRKGEVHE